MASFMCLHTQNLATITEVQWGGESIVNFGASMLAAVKRQTRRPRGITGVRQRGQSWWFQGDPWPASGAHQGSRTRRKG